MLAFKNFPYPDLFIDTINYLHSMEIMTYTLYVRLRNTDTRKVFLYLPFLVSTLDDLHWLTQMVIEFSLEDSNGTTYAEILFHYFIASTLWIANNLSKDNKRTGFSRCFMTSLKLSWVLDNLSCSTNPLITKEVNFWTPSLHAVWVVWMLWSVEALQWACYRFWMSCSCRQPPHH